MEFIPNSQRRHHFYGGIYRSFLITFIYLEYFRSVIYRKGEIQADIP